MMGYFEASELSQRGELTLAELMRTALDHPPGIKILTPDGQSARKLRRQLYGARRRARLRRDTSLEGLSMLIRNLSELWLIVQNCGRQPQLQGISRVLPLHLGEVPSTIGSRGPKRLGLLDALKILDVLADGSA